jgi:ribosomal protein RSM22 (predicted rRNA methylase)
LLEVYDQTFAQRIGWKWDAVLEEVKTILPVPQARRIIDWGCGSGIAARKYFDCFPESTCKVKFWDRSPKARLFAGQKLKERNSGVDIDDDHIPPTFQAGDLVLFSHVINEMTEPMIFDLLHQLKQAEGILWVEPGAFQQSRSLIQVREQLKEDFKILAPCPHQNLCGLHAESNQRHWCHFFARPPQEIGQSSFWAEFHSRLRIDLRRLPVSFLFLVRKNSAWDCEIKSGRRVLGHPRVYKGFAKLLICQDSDVEEFQVQKREDKNAFKELQDHAFTRWL